MTYLPVSGLLIDQTNNGLDAIKFPISPLVHPSDWSSEMELET